MIFVLVVFVLIVVCVFLFYVETPLFVSLIQRCDKQGPVSKK